MSLVPLAERLRVDRELPVGLERRSRVERRASDVPQQLELSDTAKLRGRIRVASTSPTTGTPTARADHVAAPARRRRHPPKLERLRAAGEAPRTILLAERHTCVIVFRFFYALGRTALKPVGARDGGASVRAGRVASADRCRRRLSGGGWWRRGPFCRCLRAGR